MKSTLGDEEKQQAYVCTGTHLHTPLHAKKSQEARIVRKSLSTFRDLATPKAQKGYGGQLCMSSLI